MACLRTDDDAAGRVDHGQQWCLGKQGVQLDTDPSGEQSADILTALGFPVMTSAPNYRPRTSVV